MRVLEFKWLLVCAFFTFSRYVVHGQENRDQQKVTQCYFDELLFDQVSKNPDVQTRINEMDHLIDGYVKEHSKQKGGGTEKTLAANLIIPVAVYVVHENGPENISDVQVVSQIDALNAYYSSYGIQFCLATTKGAQSLTTINTPSGITSATPGIFHYYNSALTNHNVANQATLTAISSTLPADKYLRIWVVKGITSNTLPPGQKILGYSMLPEFANSATDGIVMSYDAFGDVATCSCSTLQSYSQLGRILVHEVGHYLGLYHTFQGGCQGMTAVNCSTDGDKVCDTPPVNAPNSGCPAASWNTCTETPDLPDDIHNYMDYVSESCMTGFTNGQNDRILAAINLFRFNLVSSSNLVYTGVSCTGGLLADFTASSYDVCSGSAVTFTAISSPGATYTWDFGDGTTGTGLTASHTYTSAYQPANVVLTVTNGTNAVSSTKMIFVNTCSPIQSSQGLWYYGQRGGMNFSSGAPVYDNGSYIHYNTIDEACAVQGDALGNLLFYTNGVKVWDANHAQINVGALLKSNTSAHRGALIVPDPANSNQYYLFTKDQGYYTNSSLTTTTPDTNGFRYSIVQINAGLATTTSTWNVPVAPPAALGYLLGSNGAMLGAEGVTAVQSCDGYWIITTGKKGTQYYITIFSLTASGLSFYSETLSPFNSIQQSLEVSRDARKLAIGSGTGGSLETLGLAVFDFDTYTGTLSNQQVLNGLNTYGISFSPDSKLLYSTAWSSSGLFQYDVEAASPATTGITVYSSMYPACEMQLGPDDKLYLSSGTTSVQVVHQPNARSTTANPNACYFSPNGPQMQATLSHSMPNFIDASGTSAFSNSITAEQLSCLTYRFNPGLCANSFTWNFGDPASGSSNTSVLTTPTHTFSAPGTYTVSVTAGSTTSSITVQIGLVATINGAATMCLSTNAMGNYATNLLPGQTAAWSVSGGGIAGLNNQSDVMVIWTSLPGTVTVTITDPVTGCTATQSVVITEECGGCDCVIAPSFSAIVNADKCEVYFSNETVLDSCLQYVTYTWDFDGVILTGSTVTYAFPTAGTHNVCLTVTAFNGEEWCSEKKCKKVETNCEPPCDCKLKPEFKYSVDPETCVFTFEGFSGGPSCLQLVEYYWDFGDGNTSMGQIAGHAFAAAGSYEVCLHVIVRDAKGNVLCEEKYCDKVKVECKGKCDCKLEPTYTMTKIGSCEFLFTAFSGSSCADIENITWYVNGNPVATGQNFVFQFDVNTSYSICAVVSAHTLDVKCEEKYCQEFFYTDCYPFSLGQKLNRSGATAQGDAPTLVVYPNPATDQFYLHFLLPVTGEVEVTLKSTEGKRISVNTFNEAKGRTDVPVSIPDAIANGFVIVEVRVGEMTFVEKLMVFKY